MLRIIQELIRIFYLLKRFFEILFFLMPFIEKIFSKASSKTNEEEKTDNNIIENQENKKEHFESEQTYQSKKENKDSSLDFTHLFIKENEAYFTIHCSTKKFWELDESIQKLNPDVFKEKFKDLCPPQKPQLQDEKQENKTSKEPSSVEKRKNYLINKIYFIVEKFGKGEDFEMLPEEIKTMNPENFKDYAKENLRK